MAIHTIQHHFQDFQFAEWMYCPKHFLTSSMVKKRVLFANKYQHWTEDWMKVMFSDGSCFKCTRQSSGKVQWPSAIIRYDLCYNMRNVECPNQVMMRSGWWGGVIDANGENWVAFFIPKHDDRQWLLYECTDGISFTFVCFTQVGTLHVCYTSKNEKSFFT